MCVVICKQKEQAKPSKDFLQKAWEHNPDGAGYMYVENDRVIIRKGFMTFDKFWEMASQLPEDSAIVYHFRIATHGSRDYRGTHPFPITSDENLLQHPWIRADIGIAHNGIISLCSHYPEEQNPNNLSDTQLYIRDYLSKIQRACRNWYDDKTWSDLVDRSLSSKMAVLLPDHRIITYGLFSEVDGYKCSNTFFMPTQISCLGGYYDVKYNRPIITLDKRIKAELFDYETGEWHNVSEFNSIRISPRGAIFVDNKYKSEWGLFATQDDVGFLELSYDEVDKLNKDLENKEEEKENDNTL